MVTNRKMVTKQELNKGDLVRIMDHSYTLRLGVDKVSHKGCCEPNAWQIFKVLVTDCNMPTYMFGALLRKADTIVMGQDDNIVWLVHSGLVRLVDPQPVIDIQYIANGRDVTTELSDKSKNAVLRAHLEAG